MGGGISESEAVMNILAITGCNGSGKTTLFRQLPLLYNKVPGLYLIGGRGVMGGTDALTKKEFWTEFDWAARQTRLQTLVFEGMRWGRTDLPGALPDLEKLCSQWNWELTLGLVDTPLEECFQRVNERASTYRISLEGLRVQREKIFQTVAAYPRTLFIKDSSTVENWARNAPATVLKK